MSEQRIAKAGKLICLYQGSYSNYIVIGFFVVLRDFDPMAELAEYLDEHQEQRVRYHFLHDKYLASLLAKGFLMEIEYGTLYLGDYSRCQEFHFKP